MFAIWGMISMVRMGVMPEINSQGMECGTPESATRQIPGFGRVVTHGTNLVGIGVRVWNGAFRSYRWSVIHSGAGYVWCSIRGRIWVQNDFWEWVTGGGGPRIVPFPTGDRQASRGGGVNIKMHLKTLTKKLTGIWAKTPLLWGSSEFKKMPGCIPVVRSGPKNNPKIGPRCRLFLTKKNVQIHQN